MTDAAPSSPTWGYRPNGEARIFDLGPGEALPDGWHASPTVITDPALATAEALTEAAARSAAAERDETRGLQHPQHDRPLDDPWPDRAALVAENERLREENVRMSADVALLREEIARLGASFIATAQPSELPGAGEAPTTPQHIEIVPEGPLPTIGGAPVVAGDNPVPPAVQADEVSARSGENLRAEPDARSPYPGNGSAPVQTGQARSREEARAAVRALLSDGLTDREIARRVGVSPSTVAAVRKQAA